MTEASQAPLARKSATLMISYSRKDEVFVRKLYDGLIAHGFIPEDIWVDWEGIALSADWMKEIRNGIRASNVFLFVISPDSIVSEVCQQEIALADEGGKRFIPIMHREVPRDTKLHPKLSSHNWAKIHDDGELAAKLPDLVEAINTDLDWLERHTRLFNKAKEWDDKGRNDNNLVRGSDLTDAVTFLSEGAVKDPVPSPLHIEYVNAARKYAAAVRRRNRVITTAVGIALFGLLVFSLLQWGNAVNNLELAQTKQAEADANAALANLNADRANQNAAEAERQRKAAEASEARARRNERFATANVLAAEAANQRDSDTQLSLTLALLSIQETAQDNVVLPSSRTALFTSLNTPNVLRTWKTDNAIVWITAFDPLGRFVAIGDDAGVVRVFDANTYEPAYSVQSEGDAVLGLDFSWDGKRLAFSTGGGTARVLDAATGDEVFSLAGHDGEAINSIKFSPDGKIIATGGSDYLVKLWYAETGTLKTSLPGHTGEVNAIDFSPDGTRLVSGSRDDTAILWDVSTNSLLYKLRPDGFNTEGNYVYSVAYSWDGSRVMTGGYKTVVVWDAETGDVIQRLRGNQATVYDVDFAPDSLSMTTASSGVKVWDWLYGTQRFNLSSHAGEVNSLSFSSDGTRMVTGSWDFSAKLWAAGLRIETLRLIQHGVVNTDANYSPEGTYLFTIGTDGTVLLHDTTTGDVLETRDGIAAAYNPQNDRQYLTFDGAQVAVWEMGDLNPLRIITDEGSGFAKAAFHSNGREVLTVGNDGAVKSWEIGSDRPAAALGETNGNAVMDMFATDESVYVVTAEDNDPGLWEVGKSTEPRIMSGHTDDLIAAVFSPDGNYIYSGGYDNSIRKWDAETGRSLLVMTGHTGRVLDIAVSPDGTLVASASADTTVRVWDAETGKEIYIYQGNNEDSNSVAFSPDGKRILTASADKSTKEFTIDFDTMLSIAQEYELRNLTPEECRRYLNRDDCFLNMFGPSASAGDQGPIIPVTGGGAGLVSGDGTTPVTLVVKNNADFDVNVFWIDFDGLERQYLSLAPLDEDELGTYSTHIWRARDADGNFLEDFTATEDPKQTWEIGGTVDDDASPAPVTTTETPASPSVGAFFTEEFDGGLGDWTDFMASGSANQVEFGTDGGSLVVKLSQDEDKIPYFYLVNDANDYSSVQLEVATTNYGNNANGVSLVCHYDGVNWYEFTVSNAGLYSINYYDQSSSSPLGYVQLAGGGSAAIRTGRTANVYRAVCNGNELTLYVNDTLVKTLTDNVHNLSSGKVGIGVSSPQTLPVEVSIESLTVSEP